MTKKQRALEVIERLKKEYPDADCTLDYDEAWKLLVSVPLSVLTYHGDTHPGIGNNLLDLLPYARQQKKKSTKNYTRGGVPLHELLSTLNQYLYLFSARFSIKDFPENVNLLRPAVCVK